LEGNDVALPDYLHWPFFEARHREHAQALDAWAKSRLPPLLEDDEQDAMGATRRLVAALAEGGWLDAAVSSDPGVARTA